MRIRTALAMACLPAVVLTAAGPSYAQPDHVAVPLAKYLVVLRAGAHTSPLQAAARATGLGGTVTNVYSYALRGYAANLPSAAVTLLLRSADVAYIEPVRAVHASRTQLSAPWGLDRIDQRRLPLSGSFVERSTGAGVTAYIIDTGIRTTHQEFGGRAVGGMDAVTWKGKAADCNGHGTHVAGTVGGATYGVAKSVRLVAVRVLDCNGSGDDATVIAGIDWVTANHRAGAPAVANMSLGGSASTALDDAVRNSIADGVTYALAAGNAGGLLGSPQDSCSGSPGRVPEAITVGASDRSDAAASFSNFGSCIDLFAPGVDITSAWNTSDAATNTISGTSMATPHVAGVAALYLSGHRSALPSTVAAALAGKSTKHVVTGTDGGGLPLLSAGGTENNNLLFTDF